MVQNIFTPNDFNALLDNYHGRQATHIPVTKTINGLSGQEILTEESPVTIKCFMIRPMQSWDYKKEGFLEKGDAIALTKYADNIQLNDLLTIDGVSYRVKERYDVAGIYDSTGSGTAMTYTVCNLFLAR